MGAKKKLVARILKSEPLILKSKPLIFHPAETALKHAPKMRTKRRHAPGQPVLSSNKHANRPDSCRCRVDTCAEVIGRLIKPKSVIRELNSNVECGPFTNLRISAVICLPALLRRSPLRLQDTVSKSVSRIKEKSLQIF